MGSGDRVYVCVCVHARACVHTRQSMYNTRVPGIKLRSPDFQRNHAFLFYFFVFELGSHYVAMAGLELILFCLCLLNAGIKGVCHHVQPPFKVLKFINIMYLACICACIYRHVYDMVCILEVRGLEESVLS